MRLDPAGWPFIGGALLLAVVSGVAATWLVALPFVALAGLFVFFFRDPERSPPSDTKVVLAPADGRVVGAGPAAADAAPPGPRPPVRLLLSPAEGPGEPLPPSRP